MPSRRFVNTETAPVLYSVKAIATGGRNGQVEGGEGLKLDFAMPMAIKKSGGNPKTNPEELFAAGYSACFRLAMGLCAKGLGIKLPAEANDAVVETTAHMVGDLKQLDLGFRADILVKVRGVSREDMDKLVAKTREICPYSRATKGNVTTNVQIEIM